VFVNVTNDMTIAREEIFGPVLFVISYADEAEAFEIANDSTYGLFAYVTTSDAEHGKEVAAKIEAGGVMVNDLWTSTTSPMPLSEASSSPASAASSVSRASRSIWAPGPSTPTDLAGARRGTAGSPGRPPRARTFRPLDFMRGRMYSKEHGISQPMCL
jgi:hypothetical protein